MASESFFKDLLRSTLSSFFRVIAVGFGILALLIAFSIAFKAPPGPQQMTTATVVPNHEWKIAPLSKTAPTIVKITIDGPIGLDHMNDSQSIRNQLIDTVDGEIKIGQVKAILLCINSPGGLADASSTIYEQIADYKKRYSIPVIAFVDGMCASGGMFIACAADKIIATDSSIIGSVGVIMGPAFNFSGLMDSLGIQAKTLTAGKGKDDLNPFRPWRADEAATFQAITDACYSQFTGVVSKNRPKLTKEALVEHGAGIYAAQEAEQLGYIDSRVSTLDAVMQQIAEEHGLGGDYQVVELSSKTWLDGLFQSSVNFMKKPKVEHSIQLPGNMRAEFAGKLLYLHCPEYTH